MKTFAIGLAAGLALGILGAILAVSAGLSTGVTVAVSGGLAVIGAFVFALLPWTRPQPAPRFDRVVPGQYPPAPAWQPGVVPLRPLSVGEIFNGALGSVRANPRALLTLAAANALVILVIALIDFVTDPAAPSADGVKGVLPGLGGIGLSGAIMSAVLIVLIEQAVLGGRITAAQAWQRSRDRIPALIVLTLLRLAAAAVLILPLILLVFSVGVVANPAVFALLVPLVVVVTFAVEVGAYGLLAVAPVVVVLENRSPLAAIRRSVALCRPQLWRVVGILLLATIVAFLVSSAIAIPLSLVSLAIGAGSATAGASAIGALGQGIGSFIALPFIAGVQTLLYFDARFRSEHCDLSGADLSNADLSDADLYMADLSDADLYMADLSDPDLLW